MKNCRIVSLVESHNRAHDQIAHTLSRLLRHELNLRPDGTVKLDRLLKHKELRGVTVATIHRVVENNEKNRFGITRKQNGEYIKAFQGHSQQGLNPRLFQQRISDHNQIAAAGLSVSAVRMHQCINISMYSVLRPGLDGDSPEGSAVTL